MAAIPAQVGSKGCGWHPRAILAQQLCKVLEVLGGIDANIQAFTDQALIFAGYHMAGSQFSDWNLDP